MPESVVELTEDGYKDFIKEGKVVIKAFSDNCRFCDEYKPIFDDVMKDYPGVKFASIKVPIHGANDFKRQYMVGEEKIINGVKQKPYRGSPCTLLFQDGELISVLDGRMQKDVVKRFIETGETPAKQDPNQLIILKARIYDLMASKQNIEAEIDYITSQIKAIVEGRA